MAVGGAPGRGVKNPNLTKGQMMKQLRCVMSFILAMTAGLSLIAGAFIEIMYSAFRARGFPA